MEENCEQGKHKVSPNKIKYFCRRVDPGGLGFRILSARVWIGTVSAQKIRQNVCRFLFLYLRFFVKSMPRVVLVFCSNAIATSRGA